jgi:hypothetical protein
MTRQQRCEFLLVRYVPDAVKGEFVNIGVVLLDKSSGTAEARFLRDWRRIRRLDPVADLEVLAAVAADIQQSLGAGGADHARMLQLLHDSCANTVQISEPKALLTDSPARELEYLLEMYVDRIARGARRESAGRAAMVAKICRAFQHAGVWQVMSKKIPVAPYTHAGDPLKIDCGYRPNGVLKLFHAVPLYPAGPKPDTLATPLFVDAVKVLAFSFPQIREGVARVLGAATILTAIVEDGLPGERQEVAFALETLQRSSILVATTGDLPRLAETARQELRA